MADFLAALKDEIGGIEAQLRVDPRFRKLESLRSVLALYEEGGMAEGPQEVAAQEVAATRTVTRVPSEGRVKALELARLFLRNRVGPTPTRDIYDHIMANGGDIGGKDPVSNLSAMLSNSGEFLSNGRAGWTLAPEDGQEPVSDSVYENVAENVLADLTTEQLQDTYNFVETNRKVPQDIDGHLLGEARERVGRFLTDKESATLRGVFAKVLERHVFQ